MRMSNSMDMQSVAVRNMGGGGAPPAFVPTNLAGLNLWLDASDTATITHTTNSVTAMANKGNTGGGNASSNPGARPVTNTRTVNGLNSLDFSTGQNLILPSSCLALPNGPNSLFVVYVSDNAGDATQQLVSGRNAGGGYRVGIRFTATQLEMANRTNTTVGATTNLLDTRDTTTKVAHYRRNGTLLLPAVNGVQGTDIGNSENFTATDMQIGTQDAAAGTNRLDGRVCEVLWYDSYLSDANTNSVGLYLKNKWGSGWPGSGFP